MRLPLDLLRLLSDFSHQEDVFVESLTKGLSLIWNYYSGLTLRFQTTQLWTFFFGMFLRVQITKSQLSATGLVPSLQNIGWWGGGGGRVDR